MIDFKNAIYMKLKPVDPREFSADIKPMFVEDEYIAYAFQTVRDGIVFTDKRIIAINVQDLGGKKVSYTSLPYSKLQAFSVETAGMLDLDSELELWFNALGKIKFQFIANADMITICKFLSGKIL